ncbi:hypothetical protein CC78DRAFT_528590 [Lojkania enalia]|uniref:Transcription factor Iwr1 domain-containing protein n=1 Tax=Lojkania enalia TaxID=147567 RepID=A0A9P4NBJ6_9PLEO|nr:hypothetical protein CC78DRAFT_528590 [Didymosphaeria enalia]
MSGYVPQTLSVKRKRSEIPVDSLVVEHMGKRFKEGNTTSDGAAEPDEKRIKTQTQRGSFIFRRLASPHHIPLLNHAPPSSAQSSQRRTFHFSQRDPGARTANIVLIESKCTAIDGTTLPHQSSLATRPAKSEAEDSTVHASPTLSSTPPSPALLSTPRKRPGARATLPTRRLSQPTAEPPQEIVEAMERFANEVADEQASPHRQVSPSKFKPKAPKLRFKDRHPSQLAVILKKEKQQFFTSTDAQGTASNAPPHDSDAMDVDEYVYDTYILQPTLPGTDGTLPVPQGSIGYLNVDESNSAQFFADYEEEEVFSDDEDSNAEDYYGNDYPDEDLSEDDEYDRNAYKYYHGIDHDEYDLTIDEPEGFSEDEDDNTNYFPHRSGYWGKIGE